MPSPLSRRDLGRIGVAALASRAATSRAQTAPKATRLIVFFTPNGTVPRRWRPVGTASAYEFAPGSILEPLAPLKSELVIVDGLEFFGASNHEGGMSAMLTGTAGSNGESRGMSVDQFVARQLAAPTRFPSLELGVATSAWGASTQTRMSYAGPGQLVPIDDDPNSVAARLFGGPAMSSGTADATALRQKSVLALNRRQLLRLQAASPAREHAKLAQHRDALDRLEQRLVPPATTAACARPVLPPFRLGENAAFPTIGAAQLDLLVAALACDAMRVASLQWSHTVSPIVPTWLGLNTAHHELSHMPDSSSSGVEQFVAAERWFATQFAGLLERLKATPDPLGGGTLFDTSLVLWCKEMGDSRDHVCTNVPMVLSGRANGALRLGRWLQTSGEPHQRLLVSLCHLMGLSNGSFGDPAKGHGPLQGLA